MIFGNIKDHVRYAEIISGADKAFEFVLNAYKNGADNGRYDIENDKVYAVVSTYETKLKDECKLEAHIKYVDLQFVLDGEEIIGVAHRDGLSVSEEHSPEKDIEFYLPSQMSDIVLKKGDFVLLFPEDAHAPGMAVNKSCRVKKIVVKIKL